jgi:exopolysaccharide biosynthesis polyprenyl glycosylphosphotransferase
MFDASTNTIEAGAAWRSEASVAPVCYAPWPIPADTGHPARPLPVRTVLLLDGALCFSVPIGLTALLGAAPAPAPCNIALLAAALTLGFTAAAGGYAPGALFSLRRQAGALLVGTVCAMLVVAMAAFAFGAVHLVTANWCVAAAFASPPCLIAGRALATRSVAADRRFASRALVVGSARTGAGIASWLHSTGRRDIRIVGCVADEPVPSAGPPAGPPAAEPTDAPAVVGPIACAFDLIRQGAIEQIIVPWHGANYDRLFDLLNRLAEQPVRVALAVPLTPTQGNAEAATGALRLVPLIEAPIAGLWRTVKRIEDIALALLVLALFAVPMLLAAIMIRLDSKGPAVFRQRRVGFAGRAFWMLKFRTMHDHPPETTLHQAAPDDPRVTRVGAWLRRTSMDELPQVFNVLRGEMSMVGPRPHAPGTCAAGRPFERVAARYAARHRVPPGITGLAQVRGHRGGTETEDKLLRRIDSDLEYIAHWSPWLDFLVILRTAVCVIGMRNAY